MPLSDTAIRAAKPAAKPWKLFDERGLYIEVAPAGGKWWRFKYRFGGKEKRLSLGTYPDISLKDARERRDAARKLVAHGIDPSDHRKAEKAAKADSAANSFEFVTREWYAKHSPNWVEAHKTRILSLFVRKIFPHIGSRPIADITAIEVLKVVRRIETTALETAHRALQNCGQVFRYAVATGRVTRDPTVDLRGALPPKSGKKHFAATTEPQRLGEILLAMDGYRGSPEVCAALKLAPLVFVRPGELRKGEWSQIFWETAEWRYTSSKTKVEHIVPLSRQAVAVLRELFRFTGHGLKMFPNPRSAARPMSENAVLAAMRNSGIKPDEMSGHGFRAVARTILDEVLEERVDIIEHQLAHAVKDPNGRAYNRTAFLKERHRMMQRWADHLDTLKRKAREPKPPDARK